MAADTLGSLLREFRTGAGLTQAALAELSGLSEQAISMLERGSRRRPRIETIEALATALMLDADATERLSHAARSSRQGATAPAVASSADRSGAVPRQLPPTLSDYTGRVRELKILVEALTTADARPGTVRMAAVTGMGGVGKTALAIRAAHLCADSYPDGHLYLDLRGYGPQAPVTPVDALGQLLRSLGVDGRAVPESASEAAAVFRSRLAGLRILILLDNANSAAQVTPLLPGTSGAAVIVTSRRALTTLPGFRQVNLSPLSESDSIELLSRIAGDSRVSAELQAARSIASLTGRLPLALRLIGARLAARPSWPIDYMVDQLRNERHRLDELGTGESGVRASIAGSVGFLAGSDQELDRRAAAALDLLGLPDGTDLSTELAARLLDAPGDQAEPVLERLVDLNLLESIAPGRFRFHDLVRAYARERAQHNLSEGARDDALSRVLQLYLAVAWRSQAQTHSDSRRLALARAQTEPLPDVRGLRSGLSWLDDESSTLNGIFHQASVSPALRPLLPELALALFGFYEVRSRWLEMRAIDEVARDIALSLGFDRLAAWLQHDLGIAPAEHGDYQIARTQFLKSLEMFRATADLAGQTRCCTSLSHVLERMGEVDQALSYAEQALVLSQQIGDVSVEGISHLALGTLYVRTGDYDRAKESFQISIALSEKTGNLRSLARRYQIAGQAYLTDSRYDSAIEYLLKSDGVFQDIGDGNSQAEGLRDLAASYFGLGDYATAAARAERGLQLARANSNKHREGRLLIELGRIKAATGDLLGARTTWYTAVSILHSLSAHDESLALRLLDQNGEGQVT